MTPTRSKRALLLWSGFLSQQRINSGLWIGDNQSFLAGSGFTLLGLRLWLLGHGILLSSRFWFGEKLVPQPGIGPGVPPEWSRGCKPRLSAISSTGGQRTSDVGTGDPSKYAVPTWFRA